MVRDRLVKSGGAHNGIPWRSHEVTRIEALSDAVIAFAVTLLVVALEVPETFAELWTKMQGFLAFAISFAMLFHVWYSQHLFFRRYGMQDVWTVTLNGVLLFLVLFYMYPLKFLFTMLASQFTGGRGMVHLPGGQVEPMVETLAEGSILMTVYGLGFCAVFGIFAILYARAAAKKDELELTPQEVFDARVSIVHYLLMVGVGLLSIAVVKVTGAPAWSGLCYTLLGPVLGMWGAIAGRKRRQRFEEPDK